MRNRVLSWSCLAVVLACVAGSVMAAEKVIAWVPPGMISPYYALTIKGAEAGAKKEGYSIRAISPERETDYAGQVRIVEDMVTEGVDGIAICAINADAISAAVRKANEANIPVIVFNSLTDLPNCKVEAFVGYDQRRCGRTIVDFVAKKLNGKGNIAIIEGLPGYHTNERAGGIRDRIAEKYPDLKIVATQPGDWEREKGMNAAQNMLISHPEIDAFIGLSDEMALGAVQAARQAGRDDLIIVGNDGNPSAVESIREGRLTGSCYTYPHLNGLLAIDAFKEIFENGSAKKIWEVDMVVINAENVEEISNLKIE